MRCNNPRCPHPIVEGYRLCSNCRRRGARNAAKWRQRNPEKHREAARESQLLKRYGLNSEGKADLLRRQDGKCASCGTSDPKGTHGNPWHVDHDHKTGQVRSILCGMCNLALGCVDDDIETLRKLIAYLEAFHPKH